MSEERKPMANIPPFGLRMQPDLKAKIEESAKKNNRSLNAEIVSRLERSLLSDQEHEDIQRLISFHNADSEYVTDQYLTGKTHDPKSDVPVTRAQTDLGKQISAVITQRTELLGEVVVRELEKLGMLTAPAVGQQSPRQPTPEEMNLLRSAPSEIQPEVMEHLANHNIDAALLAIYRFQK